MRVNLFCMHIIEKSLFFIVLIIATFFSVSSFANAAAWDISSATYTSVSTSTAPATSPDGMWINTDGTKLYISNFSDKKIYQFSMSSGWDISTLAYDNKSVLVSSQGTPDDVSLSADGTKMMMLSFYDRTARQYTLSTPWDISTATYDDESLSLGSANHYDFHVKRDGTKLFSLNDYQDRVQQYTMSSAWDLSTASAGTNYSYDNHSDGQILVFTMGDNGENMYLGSATNERIHWYTLSSAWDTSTASYSDSYKSLSSEDTAIRKVVFNPAGTVMLALGQQNDSLYHYALTDVTDPIVSAVFPADGAAAATSTADLIITFAETVDAESGNITIKDASDDSTVETIDVTSGNVTGSGSATITIDPDTNLTEGESYYINIDATAFDDEAGNSYAGISNSTTWNFTIGDYTNPTASTLSPADDATDIAIGTNLVITFDETVATSTGDLVVYKTSDDSTVETIDITSDSVTMSGTEFTVDLASDLGYSTEYYVFIDATAFDDEAGNSYAGITASTTWSFTTLADPNATASTNNGGGLAFYVRTPPALPVPTVNNPDGGFKIELNNNESVTDNRTVTVHAFAGENLAKMALSRHEDLHDAGIQPFQETFYWDLCSSQTGLVVDAVCPNGLYTLYAKFYTEFGFSTDVVSDAITLQGLGQNTLAPAPVLAEANAVPVSTQPISYEGRLVKYAASPKVYKIENNTKRWITSEAAFNHYNFVWSTISTIPESITFANGSALSYSQKDPVPTGPFTRFLIYNKAGDDVKQLQQYLNSNGFIIATRGVGSLGRETTYFGEGTRAALSKFQYAHNLLPAHGHLDKQTRDFINADLQ